MRVLTIPFFADNFAYAVYKVSTQTYALVDPADWNAVSAYVASHEDLQRRLTHVFSTHKHADHSGDNALIVRELPEVKIIGEAEIPSANFVVTDGEELEIDGGLKVRALHTPCHTRGHMLYYVTDPDAPEGELKSAVFTGDTIFIGGCGRFFEGSAEEMWAAMLKLQTLPSETPLYCGHEYAIANLEWGSQIERDNSALQAKLQWARDQVSQGKHSVPSTIAQEQSYNVFMRADKLTGLLGVSDPVSAMHKLREIKNAGLTL